MKNYKNFNKIVTANQLKLSKGVNQAETGKSESKMDKLLNGILSGAYANEEEAALALFHLKPADKSFQMLKSRIKDRLISHIFQVDIKKIFKVSQHGQTFALTHKYITAGQLLMNMGALTDGLSILKNALSTAKKMQFSGLIVAAARLLRSNAGFQGTRKEVYELDKIINENIAIYAAELESDGMRDKLNIDFRETFSPQNIEKVTAYWHRINELNKKYNNHTLKINRIRIGARYYETIGDLWGIIKICDEGIKYMINNNRFYEIARHRDFANTKIEACFLLKEFELGKKNAETCMRLYSENNINSLIVFEFYIILCFHARDYQKAWELFNMAIQIHWFSQLPPERHEKWKLFEAYLFIVAPVEKRKFKLFKFLNEVTIYSKDKKGLNISIMIAQIILLLDESHFDLLIEKADSFKIYFKRYVSKHINYRTFYFVKMLELIFKYNFNYEKVKAVGEKFFKRLGDKAGRYHGDIESLEVVPYEELWAQVLLRLKNYEFTFIDPVKNIPASKSERKLKNN